MANSGVIASGSTSSEAYAELQWKLKLNETDKSIVDVEYIFTFKSRTNKTYKISTYEAKFKYSEGSTTYGVYICYKKFDGNTIKVVNGDEFAKGVAHIALKNISKYTGIEVKCGIDGFSYSPQSKAIHLDLIGDYCHLNKGNFVIGEKNAIAPEMPDGVTFNLMYEWGDGSAEGLDNEKGYKGYIVENANSSVEWDMPIKFANVIPNNNYGVGTMTAQFYYEGNLEKEETVEFTASIPDYVLPTVTGRITDVNSELVNKVGKYVQNASRLSIEASGSGIYGSSIISYQIKVNDATYNERTCVTDYIKSSGDVAIELSVTDTRGRVGKSEIIIDVLPYKRPECELNILRADEKGNKADEGTYLKAIYNTSIFSLDGKNKATYVLYYKKNGESTFKECIIAQNSSDKVEGMKLIPGFDINSSYIIRLLITDLIASTEISYTLDTAFALMDFSSGGHGVGIGKVSEIEGALETALEEYLYENLHMMNKKGIYGRDTEGREIKIIGADDNITEIGLGGYEKEEGSTSIYGNNIILKSKGYIQADKAYTFSSDSRLKHDINDIPDALIEVWDELIPKMFKLVDSIDKEQKYHIGFIAQDVIAAFNKHGINYEDYGFIVQGKYLALTYEYFDILTILVVKKQKERLNQLEKRVLEIESFFNKTKGE